METTTKINGNGHPYIVEVPRICIISDCNEEALKNLYKQTGIHFKTGLGGVVTGQPETWEQFSKVFLTYDFLTLYQNNWDGNVMFLRFNCNTPSDATLYYKRHGALIVGVDGCD